jgi:hypothetical protein
LSLPSRTPSPHIAARILAAMLAAGLAAAAVYGVRWSLFGTAVAYMPSACGGAACDTLEPRAVAGLVLFDLGVAVGLVACLFGLHYAMTQRGGKGFLFCCVSSGALVTVGLRALGHL